MKNHHILIVEDETAIAELLVYKLEKEGYKATSADTGHEAIQLIHSNPPDLILLDLMLPDMSGFELCRAVSMKSLNIPIIMLTAKSDIVDKLLGMELGADDYITKPFDIREVIVRIKAIFRRIERVIGSDQSPISSEAVVSVHDRIEIDKRQRIVRRNGEKIELKNKEFKLLLFFAENKNAVYTRPELLDQVWGFEYAGDTRTVDIHVQRLRKKLDCSGEVSIIETVFGVGYRMP